MSLESSRNISGEKPPMIPGIPPLDAMELQAMNWEHGQCDQCRKETLVAETEDGLRFCLEHMYQDRF